MIEVQPSEHRQGDQRIDGRSRVKPHRKEAMAVAILFGLAFATVLTLGLVPVLYSLFFRISFRDYVEPEQAR